MTIIIFIIILGILVFVHELGHFLFAKLFKVRVDEFGFGYPPRMFTFYKKGDTKYTMNWIPFGGFVKMFGEQEEEKELTEEEKKINLIHKKPWKQIIIMVAGAIFNLIFAWFLFSMTFMVGTEIPFENIPDRFANSVEKSELVITSVAKNSPAGNINIQTGDIITKISSSGDIKILEEREDLLSFLNKEEVEDFIISYTRDGEEFTSKIIPSENIIEGNRAIGVGIEKIGKVKLPFFYSLVYGAEKTWGITILIIHAFGDLFAGIFNGGGSFDNVSGPVGIVKAVGDANSLGFTYLLSFIALISINLTILNLLPFPALDGGRIVFVIIEWIKGSRIKPIVSQTLNAVGFGLLILLMIIVTVKDVLNLF